MNLTLHNNPYGALSDRTVKTAHREHSDCKIFSSFKDDRNAGLVDFHPLAHTQSCKSINRRVLSHLLAIVHGKP